MTVPRKRISAVVLLREPDGAALLQHRDNKPGLPHANLWVPPGGHCEDDEEFLPCAAREFYEETEYRCRNLRFLTELDVDEVPNSPPFRLAIYWDVYDGHQTVVCREGQALEFIPRSRASQLTIPEYLVDLWDQALNAWRAGKHTLTPSATPDATEPHARTFDVVTVVWGPEFRRLFLDVCVPNQLTPGNLGALPAGSRYRVFTSREDVDVLESSSVLQRVNERIPVDIVVMPELSASSRSRFGRMTACHRRALTDARESRSALIFLCADHFVSEGTFAAAVRRHDGGSRAVVCTGIRVNREAFLAALHARGGVRAVPPRELVSVALECPHPFTRAHMVDSERTARRPISVYWNVPGEGILARCFHLHPLMVDPLRRDVMPEDTIDGHYVKRSCPVRDHIHVVSDSDELAIFEMSRVDDAGADTGPGGVSLWRAAAMIRRCDSHQQSYWSDPIRLHIRDVGEAWIPVQQRSARFAGQATRLGIARRWLTFHHLKWRWRRAAKPFSARRLRRSVGLRTHSAVRRVQKLRKRAARVRRRVLRGARHSVVLLAHAAARRAQKLRGRTVRASSSSMPRE